MSISWIDNIKAVAIDKTVSLVVGAIGTLFVLLAMQFVPLILPPILQSTPPELLIALLVTSVCVNVLLVFIIYRTRKELKESLSPIFGILWDEKRNPYCPACRALLNNYGQYQSKYGFYCNQCKGVSHLMSSDGENVRIENIFND